MSELQDPDRECGAVDHDEITDPPNLNVSPRIFRERLARPFRLAGLKLRSGHRSSAATIRTNDGVRTYGATEIRPVMNG
jgi:hypothetical protein